MPVIPRTDLDVYGLCLGGNVFGWTADHVDTFRVLDAYAAAGGNFIDSADVYMAAAPGNSGGESETLIGSWLAARPGRRDEMVVVSKVGKFPGLDNLRPDTIRHAADASLRRLGVDTIDLYYAHADDPTTPLADTLGAFNDLITAGKVRYIAASNYTAPRLREALTTADRDRLPRYVALQPLYNLLEREYETDLRAVCDEEQLACFPYFSLAKGFLTGKYRPGGAEVDSVRANGIDGLRGIATFQSAWDYLDARGEAMLTALDEIAAGHGVDVAAIALSWLRQRPTVTAPIASARNTDQLAPLLRSVDVELSTEELDRLTAV